MHRPTLVAGLRLSGIVTPMVRVRPINRRAFKAHAAKILRPELRPGKVVILDSLSRHRSPTVRAAIEAAGPELRFLPPTPSPGHGPE